MKFIFRMNSKHMRMMMVKRKRERIISNMKTWSAYIQQQHQPVSQCEEEKNSFIIHSQPFLKQPRHQPSKHTHNHELPTWKTHHYCLLIAKKKRKKSSMKYDEVVRNLYEKVKAYSCSRRTLTNYRWDLYSSTVI